MSNVVDTRIVQLEFDNAQFEAGVSQTMKSLNNLNKSLELDNAADTFSNLGGQANLCSAAFNGMAQNLQLSVSEIARIQILGMSLNSLFSSLISKATSFVKAVTIDPITSGFQEYELYIDSFKSIQAGTRKEFGLTNGMLTKDERDDITVKQTEAISAALEELNHYADKTIYNFAQMTANVGKFTAAGVKLDQSVKAIEGISNLAAMSGSSSAQNNSAMYNISQALQSGKMLARDWMSIENAGMGTAEFQQVLVDIAGRKGLLSVTKKVNGKTVKKVLDPIKEGFRDSLSEGWLTKEVLLEALDIYGGVTTGADGVERELTYLDYMARGLDEKTARYYADLGKSAREAATKVSTFSQMIDTIKEAAQSGWNETWQIIIGNLDEARALFTPISEFIGKILNESAKARNKFLQDWKDAGGRDALFKGIGNIAVAIKTYIVDPFKKGFNEVFKSLTGADLAAKFKSFEAITNKVTQWMQASGFVTFLTNIGRILGYIANLIKDRILSYVKMAFTIISKFKPAFSIVYRVLRFAGDQVVKIYKAFSKNENIINKIGELINKVLDPVSKWLGKIESKLDKVFTTVRKFIRDLINGNFSSIFTRLQSTLRTFFTITIPDFAKSIKTKFVDMFKKIGEFNIQGFWEGIKSKFEKIKNKIIDIFNKVIEWVKGVFVIKSPSHIFFGIGAFVVSGFILGVLSGKGELWDTIRTIFVGWATSAKEAIVNAWDKFVNSEFVTTIKGYASSIWTWFKGTTVGAFIVAQVTKMWNTVSPKIANITSSFSDGFKNGIDALIEGFANVWNAFKDTKFYSWIKNVINILSSAFTNLINWIGSQKDPIANAFSSIGTFFSDGIADFNIMEALGTGVGKVLEFLLDAISSFITGIVKVGGTVDYGALSTLGLFIVEFVKLWKGAKSFRNAASGIKDIGKALKNGISINKQEIKNYDTIGTTLLKVAASIAIIVAAVYILAKMEWTDALRGIGMLGLILVSVVAMTYILKKINFDGMSLLKMAAGMLLIVAAIKLLAYVQWEELLLGVAKIGVMLLALSVLGKYSSGGTLEAAAAVLVLVGVVVALENISWASIFKGAVAILILSGALSVLALASKRGEKEVNANIISMAAALYIMSLAFKKLCDLDMTQLVTGMIALTAVTISLIILAKASNGFSAKGLIGLAVAMGIMAAAFYVLGNINLLKIAKAIIAFTAISIAIKSLSKSVKDLKASSAAALLIIAVALVGIAAVFYGLSLMPFKNILKGIVAFGGIVIALKILLKQMNGFQASGVLKFAGLMAVLVVSLAAIAFVISRMAKAMSGTNYDGMGKMLAGIAATMISYFAAVSLMSKIPFGTAVNGMLIVVAGLGILLAAMSVFGAIIKGLDLIDELEASVQAFYLLGSALGNLVGGIIGGIAEGVMKPLPNLGTYLSEFMENGKYFFDNAKTIGNVDSSVLRGIGTLVACLTAIAGVEFTGWLYDVIQGKGENSFVKDFSTDIENLAKGLTTFASSISGLGASEYKNIGQAADKAKTLANTINALPKNGWWEKLTGVSATANFITDCGNLAAGLIAFGTGIVPKDGEKMASWTECTTAVSVAKSITGVINALPTVGGLTSWLDGSPDFDSFITNIPKFGEAMKKYATTLSEWDNSDFDESKSDLFLKIAGSLAEFQKNLQPMDGVWQKIVGEKDIGDFGKDLPFFALGMAAYVTAVNASEFATSTDFANKNEKFIAIANSLSEFQKNLQPMGGVWQKLTGEKNLKDFAAQLPHFASLMTLYASIVTLSDFVMSTDFADKNEKFVAVANSLATLQKSLTPMGGVWQALAGEQNLSDFASQLPSFAKLMTTYAETISETTVSIDDDFSTKSKTFVDVAGELVELQKKLKPAENVWQALFGVPDLSDFATQLPGFAKGMATYATEIAGFSKTDGLTDSDVELSNKAASGVAEIAKTLNDAEWSYDYADQLNKLVGLDAFANSIGGFAEGMAAYSTTIAHFADGENHADENDIEAANKTIEALNSFLTAAKITTNSYKWTKANAIPSLKDFASAIPDFALGLKNYSTNCNGLSGLSTPEDRNASISILGALNSFIATLDGDYSKVEEFEGIATNLGTFGTNYGTFSTALLSVYDNIGDIGAATTSAIGAATQIQTFIDSLESTGSVWGAIAETFGSGSKINTFETLTEMLSTFGTNFAIFTSGISSVGSAEESVSKLETVIASLGTMIAFMNGMDTTGGAINDVINWFGGDKMDSFEDLGETLAAFGSYYKTFSDGINNSEGTLLDIENLRTILTNIVNLADDVTTYLNPLYKVADKVSILGDTFESIGWTVAQFYNGLHSALDEGVNINKLDSKMLSSSAELMSMATELGKLTPDQVHQMDQQVKGFVESISESMISGFTGIGTTIGESMKTEVLNIANMLNPMLSPDILSAYSVAGQAIMNAFMNNMLGTEVWDSIKQGLTKAAGTTVEPTVSPVLDLSSGDSDGLLSSLLTKTSEKTIELALSNESISGVINAVTSHEEHLKSIETHLTTIEGKLDTLDSSITKANYSVYLDTGVLVGNLANKIDRKLGLHSSLITRGARN